MRGIIVGLLFVALATIFGIVYAESERIAREKHVSADDANYSYALVMRLNGSDAATAFTFYSSSECETAKQYISQQADAGSAVCVPLPFVAPKGRQ